MTDSVVIPIKLTMETQTGEYQLTAAQIVFAANGIPVAQVSVAVGADQNGNIQTINLKRATPAKIRVSMADIAASNSSFGLPPAPGTGNNYLYFTKDTFVLFNGIIDDFGPGNLTFGQFDIQVRLVGLLGWLASGTLSSSNILTNAYWDTNVEYAYGEAGIDPIFMDYNKARVNFWAGLQQALLNVATRAIPDTAPSATIAKLIQEVYGGGVNQKAATVLQTITGDLMGWNPDRTREEIGAIVFSMNQYLQTEWSYEPFLSRVSAIGEMLQMAVIETGQEIKVVPYTPFFKTADAYPIGPETYVSVTQPLAPYRNMAGTVLIDGTGRDAGAPATGAEVRGLYRTPGDPLGQVHVTQIPGYIGQLVESAITGGTSSRQFIGPLNGTATALAALDTAGVFGQNRFLTNLLAKYTTWDLNYNARHIKVVCPFFRADIGPLTAVRVDYPPTAEIEAATESPSVYGSVQQVSIQIDATRGFAQTTYDIGYCRSSVQQKQQINVGIESTNEHPLFQTNYIGARLDSTKNRSHTDI